MPWIVGIDEAGYGPNLGPLVMTAAACQTPEDPEDLWQVLRDAVRRPADAKDGRIVVADSKQVYSSGQGLVELETSVLSFMPFFPRERTLTLSHLIESFSSGSHENLRKEAWYQGTSVLPLEADTADCQAAADSLLQVCQRQGLTFGPIRVELICPAHFNQLIRQWGSKGAVLAHALGELLQPRIPGDDAIRFFIDKHGGRNTYTAMLQKALPEGMVVALEEGGLRSRYRVLGLKRELQLTFQPRADAEHFCVALASMVSKYLRELLMREFNAFWQSQVPGLKPTAGYPLDAVRFYDAILPAVQRLGIAEETVWRKK